MPISPSGPPPPPPPPAAGTGATTALLIVVELPGGLSGHLALGEQGLVVLQHRAGLVQALLAGVSEECQTLGEVLLDSLTDGVAHAEVQAALEFAALAGLREQLRGLVEVRVDALSLGVAQP